MKQATVRQVWLPAVGNALYTGSARWDGRQPAVPGFPADPPKALRRTGEASLAKQHLSYL